MAELLCRVVAVEVEVAVRSNASPAVVYRSEGLFRQVLGRAFRSAASAMVVLSPHLGP